MNVRRVCVVLFWLLLVSDLKAEPALRIEYISHACFIFQSPEGTRLLIDPFNGYVHGGLGYSFPEGIEADGVLVTHPHYDHDATYLVGGSPPVFRDAGNYSINDIKFEGIEGKHGDPFGNGYGRTFGRRNTIWIVEAAGVRVVHLGDNGPIDTRTREAFGNVDILLVPIDGDEHILRFSEVGQIVEEVQPSIVVPMHYEVSALAETPGLGPVDPWLSDRENVRRLETNLFFVSATDLPEHSEVVVFAQSPHVAPWPENYRMARSKLQAARQVQRAEPAKAEIFIREAVELYPSSLEFWWALSGNLGFQGKLEEAIDAMERGFSVSTHADWTLLARARLQLGEQYERHGRRDLAIPLYQQVVNQSQDNALRERAQRALDK